MKKGTQQALPELAPMIYAGLSVAEISRLVALRSEVTVGLRNEDPQDHPRVAFVKYLVAQGKIHD